MKKNQFEWLINYTVSSHQPPPVLPCHALPSVTATDLMNVMQTECAKTLKTRNENRKWRNEQRDEGKRKNIEKHSIVI